MKDLEREARINAALEAAIPAWDAKYGHKQVVRTEVRNDQPAKATKKIKRVSGGIASKALKNLY